MKIILIGIQGSGKSTQGNLLSQALNLPYLSTGHIFREIAKEKTHLGRYVKEVMTAGYLIPDEIANEMILSYLHHPEYQKGFILDGFPRTIDQVEAYKESIDYVIYINISNETALARLSFRSSMQGREDDTKKAIEKRIESFHTFTKPVLDYYRKKRLLIEVNGNQSIEAIHNEIMEKINKK